MAAITFSAYPFRGYDTSEAEYSRILDAALGGSGMLEEPTFYMSGMSLVTGALDGIVRGHRFQTPAGGSFDMASTTSARIAVLCATLAYTGSPIVKPTIKYGTTSPPALTQTKDTVFELPLWQVAIPANALTLGTAQVTQLWTRLRSPSSAMIYVQSTRPNNPPINSIRIW